MVTRTGTDGFEQSSESGRERHLPVPWTRLTDTTPTLGDPAQITGLPAGTQQTGTVIVPGSAGDPVAIINTADGAVYAHNVRNVVTYNAGPVAEATWRAINIGDTVYYDPEQDTLNGIKLSLCPLQSDGATANARFGHITTLQDEDSSDYSKGTALAGSTHVCGVEQGQ